MIFHKQQEEPQYLLLSERMGNGETLTELINKAHKILEGEKEVKRGK